MADVLMMVITLLKKLYQQSIFGLMEIQFMNLAMIQPISIDKVVK